MNKRRYPTPEGHTAFTAVVPNELHRAIKIRAFMRGVSMREAVMEAMESWIARTNRASKTREQNPATR